MGDWKVARRLSQNPFISMIFDDATGTILFMGRVDDPTATS